MKRMNKKMKNRENRKEIGRGLGKMEVGVG